MKTRQIIKNIWKNVFLSFICSIMLAMSYPSLVWADEKAPLEDTICTAYLSGIGCHNCAITDPILFGETLVKQPNLIVFDYEIFKRRVQNYEVKTAYFNVYAGERRPGVPFFILNKEDVSLGRFEVAARIKKLPEETYNACPLPDGSSVNFRKMDFSQLYGKVNIWTKNRVLISEERHKKDLPKDLLLNPDVTAALKNLDFHEIDPIPVDISEGEIEFDHAVLVHGWRLQWNGEAAKVQKRGISLSKKAVLWILAAFFILGSFLSTFQVRRKDKGVSLGFSLEGKRKDWLIVVSAVTILILFFVGARTVSSDILSKAGYRLPLPIFTFFIALVDGFNPCNMFVLTCLLVLLVTTSHERKRLFVVSLTFVFTVFVIYFLFMAAWLNVFKTIEFITPLRIGIGIIALVAGLINCKELLFFKKGISLTIQDQHKGPLLKRIHAMKDVVLNGSYPLLISSSLGLAALASLVELPCTAGFPIIYTGILSGRQMDNTVWYYLYLVFYNIVYVIPLLVIISIFIYTFRAKYITQRQVEVMKFIGGFIMIALGIILLVNPGLIGLKIG